MRPAGLLLILSIGLLLALAAPRVLAQPGQVVLEPTTPLVETPPRGVVTLTYRVTNETGGAVALIPQVELPPDWRVVVPPDALDLEDGASSAGLFMVFVPAEEQAGQHAVVLEFQELMGIPVPPARFWVRVASLDRVEVVPLEAPTYAVAGQTYEARFSVRNAGNTTQELTFDVLESVHAPIRIDPPSATLEPGAGLTVAAHVSVPADLSRPTPLPLTLTVSGLDGRVRAQASVKVEAIPRTPPESLGYHTFPLRLRLEPESATGKGVSLDWHLWGTGRVSDRDPGLLTVDLQAAGAYAAYRRSTLSASLGRQRFTLSPLTEPGTLATGVAIAATEGPWQIALHHHGPTGPTSEESSRTGIQASHRWSATGERLSLQALAQPELSATVFSVGVEKRVTASWRIGTEIGVQSDPVRPAGAVRVETSWAELPFSGRLSWEHTDPGYRDRGVRERTQLVSSLLLGRQGYLTLSWESTAGAGEAPDEYELGRQFALQVGGVVGGHSWGVRYVRRSTEETEGADSPSQKDEHSLRLHLFQGLTASDVRLFHSVEWGQTERAPAGAHSHSASYQMSLRLPVLTGHLTPYAGIQAQETEDDRESRWRAGVRWDHRLGRDGALSLLGSVEQARERTYRAWGSLTRRLANRAELTLQAQRRWIPNQGSEATVKLGLTLPLSLPVGSRSDVGELAGRLVGEDGQGLPGLVVRVNGYAATTDEEGRFRFPALPAGTAVLTLIADQLGPERITQPELPWRVEVAAGETVEQTFRVVRAARVQGTISLQNGHPPAAPAGVVLAEGDGFPPGRLEGIVVELRNHQLVLRRVTDADGRFAFERVPPGEWTVVPRIDALNGSYRLEPERVALHLDPGEDLSVELALVPLERRIRFIDEGTLTSNGP